MPESVEEFLARGGKINKIETGKTGQDMTATYKAKVKRSSHARYKHKSGVPITIKRRD
jgi:hypothetical protein